VIRVVVADDQELIRDGLALMLDASGAASVVGRAADGAEAVALARRLQPDVVLMDVRMPSVDGIAATRTIVREVPAARVVVLTTYDLDDYVVEALQAGAVGYLLKDTPRKALVAAVTAAAAGDMLLDPSVVQKLIQRRRPVTLPPTLEHAMRRLTPRERDVLAAVAEGRSNAEIAEHLTVSEATVKTHVARILDKLDARDRVQLVVLAHRYTLTKPSTTD
jgi:DNA-binding NarL/FixJ family response regulator